MLAMGYPSPMEIAVIVLIALLLFGRRLPEAGRSLGQGIKEFKKGIREGDGDASDDTRRV